MLLATYDAASLIEAWSSHNHFEIKGQNFKLLPLFYDELWVTHTDAHTPFLLSYNCLTFEDYTLLQLQVTGHYSKKNLLLFTLAAMVSD